MVTPRYLLQWVVITPNYFQWGVMQAVVKCNLVFGGSCIIPHVILQLITQACAARQTRPLISVVGVVQSNGLAVQLLGTCIAIILYSC